MSQPHAAVPAGSLAAAAAAVSGFFLGLWALNRLVRLGSPPPPASGTPPRPPVFGRGFPD